MNQVRLGNRGEKLAQQALGGRRTQQRCPFDVLDKANGYAYEVKTQQAKRLVRVHIQDAAYERKVEYAAKRGYMPMLVLIVIHSPWDIRMYKCVLRQHARPSNMVRVQ